MHSYSVTNTRCRYWLPSITKHTIIALRFLPQAAYEEAATLRITPQPDVVTRVFMLFRGVSEEDYPLWADALPRDQPAMWKEIIGVDLDRQKNETLFRVLEWGGMEVKKPVPRP